MGHPKETKHFFLFPRKRFLIIKVIRVDNSFKEAMLSNPNTLQYCRLFVRIKDTKCILTLSHNVNFSTSQEVDKVYRSQMRRNFFQCTLLIIFVDHIHYWSIYHWSFLSQPTIGDKNSTDKFLKLILVNFRGAGKWSNYVTFVKTD